MATLLRAACCAQWLGAGAAHLVAARSPVAPPATRSAPEEEEGSSCPARANPRAQAPAWQVCVRVPRPTRRRSDPALLGADAQPDGGASFASPRAWSVGGRPVVAELGHAQFFPGLVTSRAAGLPVPGWRLLPQCALRSAGGELLTATGPRIEHTRAPGSSRGSRTHRDPAHHHVVTLLWRPSPPGCRPRRRGLVAVCCRGGGGDGPGGGQSWRATMIGARTRTRRRPAPHRATPAPAAAGDGRLSTRLAIRSASPG